MVYQEITFKGGLMTHDFKKRYWVFGIEEYYPAGGIDDVEDTFDTLAEAELFFDNRRVKYTDTLFEIWNMEDRIKLKSTH